MSSGVKLSGVLVRSSDQIQSPFGTWRILQRKRLLHRIKNDQGLYVFWSQTFWLSRSEVVIIRSRLQIQLLLGTWSGEHCKEKSCSTEFKILNQGLYVFWSLTVWLSRSEVVIIRSRLQIQLLLGTCRILERKKLLHRIKNIKLGLICLLESNYLAYSARSSDHKIQTSNPATAWHLENIVKKKVAQLKSK